MKRLSFKAAILIWFMCVATALPQEKTFVTPAASTATAPKVAPEIEKSNLLILFVGQNPDQQPIIPSYVLGLEAERFPELKRERMAAFRSLLEQHFESVKYLNSEDYKVAISDEFDVTIFDDLPPPIQEVDEGTWTRKLRMPLDFDRPALLVGEVAPVMLGRLGIGLRLDHL